MVGEFSVPFLEIPLQARVINPFPISSRGCNRSQHSYSCFSFNSIEAVIPVTYISSPLCGKRFSTYFAPVEYFLTYIYCSGTGFIVDDFKEIIRPGYLCRFVLFNTFLKLLILVLN